MSSDRLGRAGIEELNDQAEMQLRARRFADALRGFDAALDLDSENCRSLIGKARCLRRLGELEAARLVLGQASIDFPDNAGLWTEQGLLNLGQWDLEVLSRSARGARVHALEALGCFERARQLDGDHAEAVQGSLTALRWLRRYEEAGALLAQAMMRWPEHPGLHLEAGWLAADQYKVDAALAAFNRALAIDPTYLTAAWSRIDLLQRIRRDPESRRMLTEAITHWPDSAGLHSLAGLAAADLDDFDEAFAALDRALELDPSCIHALAGKASLLSRLHRYDKARKVLADALTQRPDSPTLHISLAEVAYDEGRYEQALGGFNETLAVDPDFERAFGGKADTLRWLERYDEADQVLAEGLERWPDSPLLQACSGRLAVARRRVKDALDAFDRALEVDPDFFAAVRDKTRALRESGQFDDAQQVIEQALARHPEESDPYVWLGGLAQDQNQHEQALVVFDQALSVSPGNGSAGGMT
jgi:tetratricopeptide (TPR) repeat protein